MTQPQLHAINFKGKLIVVKKESADEPRHEFIKRTWWIARNLEKYKTYEEVESLSHIWLAHTMHNAIYEPHILSMLN